MKILKILNIFVLIFCVVFGEKLLMVSREKYEAKCLSSASDCKMVIEPSYINYYDWTVNCNDDILCQKQYVSIILNKPYDIIQLSVHQLLTAKNKLLKSIYIQFNLMTKKSYKLNSYLSHLLLESDEGKDTNNIKITPNQLMSSVTKVGFNFIIAYAYYNGRIKIFNL